MTGYDDWARLLAGVVADRTAQPRRICELCVRTLDVSGGSISMVTKEGNQSVICATDDVSASIEDLQFILGEGPSVDAVRGGSPVLVADLTDPGDVVVERWLAFMDGSVAAGVRAIFVFPLRIGAISVGTLGLYRDRPGDLEDRQLAACLMAADAAALALLNLDPGNATMLSGDIDGQSTSHHQVHQATGMVQVQLGVPTHEALLALRARAFAADRPLAGLATDVVERRLRFSTEDR